MATTAERIVDLAQEMIQKRGFHAFSYRDVSAAMGIRTASIHYHFPRKADLAAAVLERVQARLGSDLARIEEGSASAVERLRRFCDLFLATYGRGDRLCPVCMLAMGQEAVPPEVRQGVRAFWATAENWVHKVLRAGEKAKELRLLAPPRVVARTFVAALEGAMIAARAFGERRRLTEAIDYLLAGVAAPPAEGQA